MCNEFRFFTPLRCVQNDREGMLRSEYRITLTLTLSQEGEGTVRLLGDYAAVYDEFAAGYEG